MIKSRFLQALFFLSAFLMGVIFYKYQIFPLNLASKVFSGARRNAAKIIERQYEPRSDRPQSTKSIDTGLLPLVIKTIDVGNFYPVANHGGSICALNDRIIIVNRLGDFFVYGNGVVRNAALERVPNHLTEFAATSKYELDAYNFRVHDCIIREGKSSSTLFLTFEKFDPATKKTNFALASVQVGNKDFAKESDWALRFESKPLSALAYSGQAAGGRMALLGEQKLLFSVGNYNQDGVIEPQIVSQDIDGDLGAVFLMDLRTNAIKKISYGHRNAQGLAVARNGAIYETEHGPQGGDEINILSASDKPQNYGWPIETLGVDYGTYAWPRKDVQGRHDRYVAPIFAFLPSIGISNLIEAQGFDERWNGDLLVSSLKGNSIFRLRLSKDGRSVIYSEPIWIGERIRNIVQRHGKIFLWTDSSKIIEVGVDRVKLASNRSYKENLYSKTYAKCMLCHHTGDTNPGHAAPSLSHIVGGKIGADSFDQYSPAMKGFPGIWTPEKLRAFLVDPESIIKGTTMPKQGLTDKELDDIIAVLSANKN